MKREKTRGPKGVKQFQEFSLKWEKDLENILIEMHSSTTDKDLKIPMDITPVIESYDKLSNDIRKCMHLELDKITI